MIKQDFRLINESLIFITGFLLDKKIGVNQPKRMEDAKILIANTAMDTDKIKVGCIKMKFHCF